MRNVIQLEQNFGSVPIESIEFDANSRDDIPAVLKGLQLIWSDKEKREALFSLLETYFLPGTDLGVGRPGMNMWRILVLSVLKQSLGCDFDRLQELANKHSSVRRMMGHGDAVFDGTRYERRTIAGNVSLLAPELLNDVNGLIVAAGHEVSKRKPGESLAARCDSFVVETNVHFPTDVNLLWDATRALLRETQRACAEFGIGGWRQRQHLEEKARKLFRKVGTASRWKKRPKEVAAHIEFCGRLADRAEASLAELGTAGAGEVDASMILRFLEHARRQIDQIDRRLLKGETIPHAEKVFSVFEEHTRWISKGKAGTPVELGVPVAIVEDQFQFILGRSILWKGGDVDVAIPIVENCRERHPDLRVCSFDRGFHSPANRVWLEGRLETAALPKKGRLNKDDIARESAPAFVRARRRHPAVESAINNLEKRGLDRVRTKGAAGFERTVGLSILAANLHRIGLLLQRGERRRLERLRKRRLKAA